MKKVFIFCLLLIPALLLAQGGDDGGGGIWTIISIVFAAVTTLFAGLWKKLKGKLGDVANLGKEGLDVINKTVAALEDDKLTKAEAQEIKKEAQEFIGAWKQLIGK